MNRLVLAIDCGSTNFKAALFSGGLERIGEDSRPTPYLRHDAAAVELDPQAVWATLKALIAGLCEKCGVAPCGIDAIAIASQAQTFAVLDAAGGTVAPFISWIDRRAETEARELTQAFGRGFHSHCSFAPPSPQLQAAKMLWVRRQMAGALTPGHTVVSLPSFLTLKLAGVNLIDSNLAAMSGMFSLQRDDWWPEMLDVCGVRVESLPRLVRIGEGVEVCGCDAGLGLPGRFTLVMAGNDQTAGAFGNGCQAGEAMVTLGTALVAYRVAGGQAGPYNPAGCWGPYPGGGYYELAVRDEGCLALDWARQQLMPGLPVSRFDAAAEQGARLIERPQGFFFPARIRSDTAWVGVGSEEEKAFAVLEGIAFSLRQLVREELACPQGTLLRAIGGGSRNRFWLQLIADSLACPVELGVGDSLTGAARMAMPGRGRPGSWDECRIFVPESGRVARLERRYRAWKSG